MLVVGALLAGACTDQVTNTAPPPDATSRSSATAADSSHAERIEETPILERFDVKVRAEGSFQPGKPIRIIASVGANLSSPQTRIRITAPEAAAAAQSGWGEDFRVPVGTPLPALGGWTQRLSARQQVQRSAELVVPAPGLYSVVVSVHDPSRPSAGETGGHSVQTQAQAELWIEVTEQGGRAAARFDPSFIPQGMRDESGPFRRRGEGRGGAASPNRSVGGASRSMTIGMPGGDHYQATYRYVEGDNVSYRVLPDARLFVRYYDSAGSVVDMLFLRTDDQGRYTVPCRSSAWTRYEAQLALENDRVQMVAVGWLPAATGSAMWCGADWGTGQSRFERSGLNPWVFENMSFAAKRTLQHFGYGRPQVNVLVSSGADVSAYTRSDDRITIKESSAVGGLARWVTAHEYGHAYHEKALGGIAVSPCGTHYRDGAHSLSCAFAEGFADYVAAVARTEETYPFQVNQYYPALRGSGNKYDGSIIEGAVAAFLLDLSDEYPDFYPQEPWDRMSVPGGLVADLIRTCEARTWMGWQRATGVDHLVYCLEGVADAALYNQGYFQTRGLPPYEVRMSSAHALPARRDVRELWINNLYDPARQPGGGGGVIVEPEPEPEPTPCPVGSRDAFTCTDY